MKSVEWISEHSGESLPAGENITSSVELLMHRAKEQDSLADLHFAEGRPWKAHRFASLVLRQAAKDIYNQGSG